jgi:quinoprotein glucose dehydrogenase
MKRLLSVTILAALASCKNTPDQSMNYLGWESYGGSKENIHYSQLTEIDTSNVSSLRVAWTFHTGDADTAKSSQIQCNPIIVDTVMYVTSPALRLFALHAATGKKIWEFNPDSNYLNRSYFHFAVNNNRGVTYWTDGKGDNRIFFVAGSSLHCVDASKGTLITSFGKNGIYDLHDDLGRDVKDLYITATSPGIIYKDLFIVGSRVDEGPAAAPGYVRALDARTGRLRWIFHTIPQPGELGYDSWTDPEAWKHVGGANSWSGLSLDEKRGILFAPTGSASFDFYGGKRLGQNLFANCLLALNAETGKHIWHFQFIHHDVWDWDLPSPPALVTITRDGKKIDAVAQTTKNGMLWLFDRETGTPLHPFNEVPVDTANPLPGEKLWPTQPVSGFSKPFVRQSFTADDITPFLVDSSLKKVKQQLSQYEFGKMFIVPSMKTRVQLPGFDGGAEWGGPAYDPESGVLYVNANECGWLVTLRENKAEASKKENYIEAGVRLYNQHCLSCHGADRKGTGNYPSLENINARYNYNEAFDLLNSGRRMMPSFRHVSEQEKKAILLYVLESKQERNKEFKAPAAADPYRNLPYSITGYYKFLSPEGYPAIKPPWGTITAIDLNTGEHLWKNTLGEYPELRARGIPPTGTENYGGAVVTAGGLLFIAAARDAKMRAFNKKTGKLVWEHDLPAAGFATPAVYRVNGRQYLVIACGGGKLRTKSGDAYVAFSLPETKEGH